MGKRALIRKEYGWPQKWVLSVLLGASLIWVGHALFWFYEKLRHIASIEVAQLAFAVTFVFVLVLIGVGIRLGYRLDRMIQEDRMPVPTATSARWLDFIFRLWKHERKYPVIKKADPESVPKEAFLEENQPDPIATLEEIRAYILAEERENPPSSPKPEQRRRGRRPTFPVGRWVPVALKWESHDPLWDDYSLGDVISEYLGVAADGSPIISDQAYRKKWRDLALEEAKRMVKSGEMTDPYQLKLFKKYYEKKLKEG